LSEGRDDLSIVMPGLVPGIHVFLIIEAWMAGTSAAMTALKAAKQDVR
jgi:hypothetical protein